MFDRSFNSIKVKVIGRGVGTRMREVFGAAKGCGRRRNSGFSRQQSACPMALSSIWELILPMETVPIQAQAQVIWSARNSWSPDGMRRGVCQFTRNLTRLDRGKNSFVASIKRLRDRKPALVGIALDLCKNREGITRLNMHQIGWSPVPEGGIGF